MRIGFTGTRSGMTPQQRDTIARLLAEILPTEIHHGDCVGADAEFAELCAGLTPRPRIVAHPGESAKGGEGHLRANSPHNDAVLPTKTHFARNRDLVDIDDVMIAAPFQTQRQESGGTWYTCDYAGKRKKRLVIVWPDGNSTQENSSHTGSVDEVH